MKKPLLAFSSLVLSLGMSSAFAQNPTPQQAYQDALHHCTQLTDSTAQANCKRDAGAAFQQARHNPPAKLSETTLQQNRLSRCKSLPSPAAQQDCVAHMTGQAQTQTFGSVQGGGVLRRSTITIQGEPVPVPPTGHSTRPSSAQPAPVR